MLHDRCDSLALDTPIALGDRLDPEGVGLAHKGTLK